MSTDAPTEIRWLASLDEALALAKQQDNRSCSTSSRRPEAAVNGWRPLPTAMSRS